MKVSVSKSKNTTIYYLSKSVRIDGRVTTKTIEKIGSYEEIKKICGDMDPLEWAKQYAAKRTREEKESKSDTLIRFSSSARIEKGSRRSANVGYFFPKDIYYSLGLDRICAALSDKYRFEFDLNDILSMLIYTRILFPGSKRASLSDAGDLLEPPACSLHQVYRALEVLAKENDYIQAQLYKNSEETVTRDHGVLYYDCTNYYFEIEEEDAFRKYGHSKEHRPNPVVQMGLFMDADGIPLSFSLFPGNESEQPSMNPLEKKILSDFGLRRFIVCTDAGLSSTQNRRFNDTRSRKFVTTQSLKKMKGHLQDFCLAEDGWRLEGSQRTYTIPQINAMEDHDLTFYKDRWICEDGLEQHLIVTYSVKYRDYQRCIRDAQVERAAKLAGKPSSLHKKAPNDPRRFIREDHCTPDGEIAETSRAFIDEDIVREEERYDGFYAVCTNLEDDIPSIIRIKLPLHLIHRPKELLKALCRQILRLHRNNDAVSCRQGIDRQHSKARHTVDQDVVIVFSDI